MEGIAYGKIFWIIMLLIGVAMWWRELPGGVPLANVSLEHLANDKSDTSPAPNAQPADVQPTAAPQPQTPVDSAPVQAAPSPPAAPVRYAAGENAYFWPREGDQEDGAIQYQSTERLDPGAPIEVIGSYAPAADYVEIWLLDTEGNHTRRGISKWDEIRRIEQTAAAAPAPRITMPRESANPFHAAPTYYLPPRFYSPRCCVRRTMGGWHRR